MPSAPPFPRVPPASVSSAIAVAEQLARLVEGILLDRPEALRERTLGALLHAVIQSEPTTLEPRQLDLIANGEVVTARGAGIAELAAQIRGHEVKSLTIGPDASPAELLAVDLLGSPGVVEGGSYRVIRRRETYQDLIAAEQF